MVCFKHLSLYIEEEIPCYKLDRRLHGPQDRSGRCGKVKNFVPLPEVESQARRGSKSKNENNFHEKA
jgi:hypothetical protein